MNININKLAKELTGEEFLKEYAYDNGCPSEHGITNDECDCGEISCRDCWNRVVKDIQFKDDKQLIFDLEEYKSKDIAINCETEEEAREFFNILIMNGIDKWRGGEKLDNNQGYWIFHKQDTCYCYIDNNEIVYANKDWTQNKIYKFKDIDFSNVYNKESIDNVALNKVNEFDITKVKSITREQLDARGFKTGDILFLSDKRYGLIIYDRISYLCSSGFDYIKTIQFIISGIIPIENQKDIAGRISWFIQDRLYDNIKRFVITIQNKQVTICIVQFVADTETTKEFVLETDVRFLDIPKNGDIIECKVGSDDTWQYARVKEIEKRELTENEIKLYRKCRKLS